MKAEKPLDEIQAEEKVRKCPDCGSRDIDNQNGEVFCKKCGLVLD